MGTLAIKLQGTSCSALDVISGLRDVKAWFPKKAENKATKHQTMQFLVARVIEFGHRAFTVEEITDLLPLVVYIPTKKEEDQASRSKGVAILVIAIAREKDFTAAVSAIVVSTLPFAEKYEDGFILKHLNNVVSHYADLSIREWIFLVYGLVNWSPKDEAIQKNQGNFG